MAKYILYFDGGSRGNPGISGAGFIIFQEKENVQKEIASNYHFVSKYGTNNESEYTGLVKGLELALKLKIDELVVRGDSKLVIKQVQGLWKVKAENLQKYHTKAVSLKSKFKKIKFEHVLRHLNKDADMLANMAMDNGRLNSS